MPYRPIVVIEAGLGRTFEMSIEPCNNLWYLCDARVAGLTGFVQLVGQVSLGYLVNKPNEDKTFRAERSHPRPADITETLQGPVSI